MITRVLWAIARLISQGLSNKDIGENLKISYWTVNTYLKRIFSKLGVTSRTAMVTRLMAEHREQFFAEEMADTTG
jgi:DNA-binding NarL/FixJ family response regulator